MPVSRATARTSRSSSLAALDRVRVGVRDRVRVGVRVRIRVRVRVRARGRVRVRRVEHAGGLVRR